jgi:hypothetical protein
MTKDEIHRAVVWRDTYEARAQIFSPAFDQTVEVSIYTAAAETISDRSIHIINDFIALTDQHLNAVKSFLWQDCQSCCNSLSWGVLVPAGKTEAEANHEDLGVLNADDAYVKASLKLKIYEDAQKEYEANYGHLTFDTHWNSHFVAVIMKNGNIVGFGNSGLWLGAFETPIETKRT